MPLLDHEITLSLESIELRLLPYLGGSISGLKIRNAHDQWAPVFRTFDPESSSVSDTGSFPMAPWTNRIKDARFSFLENTHQLQSNSNDQSAIHGVVRSFPWRLTDRSPISARMVFNSKEQPIDQINYPFAFGAIQRFEISPNSITIDLSITNLDSRPIPIGVGHHPYIHRHLFSNQDQLSAKLHVDGRYPAEGCIPTGDPIDDEICARFRDGHPIGNPGLDDVFSGFQSHAQLIWDQSEIIMDMSCSSNMNHLVVYTPQNEDGSENEFVCIEPTTMVNDGFNRAQSGNEHTGVQILEPNETINSSCTISFSGAGFKDS